jgi:hypothetical protein
MLEAVLALSVNDVTMRSSVPGRPVGRAGSDPRTDPCSGSAHLEREIEVLAAGRSASFPW